MNGWSDLSERERRIVYLYVVKGEKFITVAREVGVSRTRLWQLMGVIHRLLGVEGRTGLAVWVGQNWDLVNAIGKPKVVRVG